MPDVQNVQELNSGALKINFELDILFKSIYTNDLIYPVKVNGSIKYCKVMSLQTMWPL